MRRLQWTLRGRPFWMCQGEAGLLGRSSSRSKHVRGFWSVVFHNKVDPAGETALHNISNLSAGKCVDTSGGGGQSPAWIHTGFEHLTWLFPRLGINAASRYLKFSIRSGSSPLIGVVHVNGKTIQLDVIHAQIPARAKRNLDWPI